MWVSHLSLTDFRSYPEVRIDLLPGVTTFVGSNGQGKTNLVEAIGYIATLASHRVASDVPLVRIQTSQGIIRCSISAHDREALVEIAIMPGKANKARINRSAVPRVRDVLGILRVVVFAPEDLALVKGDPSDRRRFLDELLVQRTPRLAGTISDLDRVLKQRNALLKSASVARRSAGQEMLRTLQVWDEQLARLGAELIVARLELLDDLRPAAVRDYEYIAQDLAAELDLLPASSRERDAWDAALLEAMQIRRDEELNRGVTLVGPHRDDLAIRMGPVPAKGYASHGESWSIALALRLASFAVLKADGDDPVLILDDVFAELDVARRERLAQRLREANQVLITAAVDADIPTALSGSRFRVDAGKVSYDL